MTVHGELSDEALVADAIGLAERGENPTALMRLSSGWVVFGLTQLLPGYCVLIAAPEVRELNDLDAAGRAQFLADMTLVGDAIRAECRPSRLNYEILGNELPILHAHIRPRYEDEPDEYRSGPGWFYQAELRKPEHSWRQPQHRALMERLRSRMNETI